MRLQTSFNGIVLAVHGGAGTLSKQAMTLTLERRYREKLAESLTAGYTTLKQGGASVDAVVAAIKVLENSPLFNAGKGAVFNHSGRIELDAAIMNGCTHEAGAVGAVTVIKNPIVAARAVMEETPHVLLVGKAADRFARASGLSMVDSSYFRTSRRWKQLEDSLAAERPDKAFRQDGDDGRFGTVGAVAVDESGNLAAGTSTGGVTNKLAGRLGDSAIVGAGTYADNQTCAVSTTGHGESFIRQVVAYDIAALMKYSGLSVEEAARRVILGTLKAAGGAGGCIALDRRGNCAMPLNTPGMYRGCISHDGKPWVAIYR